MLPERKGFGKRNSEKYSERFMIFTFISFSNNRTILIIMGLTSVTFFDYAPFISFRFFFCQFEFDVSF